jgi:hypothetical protein
MEGGAGEEMAQTMYTHMNKCINNNKKSWSFLSSLMPVLKKTSLNQLFFHGPPKPAIIV